MCQRPAPPGCGPLADIMRAVREWGGTKARTEKTAPTEGDTEQWLSTGVNQKIALSNDRRPTSREERVCPWRIGVVDTQCSINPRVYREGTLYRKRGIATAWRMVLGTRSDFNGGAVGRHGRSRVPALFLVEAQLLENGSLSQERLQSSRGGGTCWAENNLSLPFVGASSSREWFSEPKRLVGQGREQA